MTDLADVFGSRIAAKCDAETERLKKELARANRRIEAFERELGPNHDLTFSHNAVANLF